MRRAIAEAEVVDEEFDEDPTVIALEERAAALLGKEAALLVASGTMANVVSQLGHLRRGQETITGANTHIVHYEQAGHAVIVGTSARQLHESPDGTFDLTELDEAFNPPGILRRAPTGMVALENTHAETMAQPLSVRYTQQVADITHRHGCILHIDGARFFNAAVALGVSPRELAAPADSVAFCLSKGLACPAGSIVVGERSFIERARRGRKLVGGGMHKTGILAAAGLLALREGPDGMIERLAEDHANARRLAEGLAELDGIVSAGGLYQPVAGPLDPSRAATNFVVFKVRGSRGVFLDALRTRGVLMLDYSQGTVRAVTHYGIDAGDIDRVLAACAGAIASVRN